MASIGSLIATLGMNTANFDAGIKGAGIKTSAFRKKAMKDFNAVRSSVNRLGGAMGFLTGAIAAVVGPAALVRLTKQSYAAADAQGKLADTLGITVSALAGFELAGERTGATAENVKKSLEKLAVNVGDAAKGVGAASEAFIKLGLDADQLMRLPLDEQFKQVADAMKGVDNATERVGIAYDIFGRQGTNVVKMLQLSREELEKFEQRAEDLGVALKRWEITNIEDANDAVLEASKAMEGFGNIIALKTSPIVKGLADNFTESAVAAKGFRSEVDTVIDAIVTFSGGIANGIQLLKLAFYSAANGWAKLGAVITDYANQLGVALSNLSKYISEQYSGMLITIRKVFTDFLRDINNGIKASATGTESLMVSIANSIRDAMAAALEQIIALSKAANGFTNGMFDEQIASAEAFVDSLRKVNQEALDGLGKGESMKGFTDQIDAVVASLEKVNAKELQELYESLAQGPANYQRSDLTDFLISEAASAKEKIDEIMNSPLPSDALRAWVEEMRKAAADAAAITKAQMEDGKGQEEERLTWTQKLTKEGQDKLKDYVKMSEGEQTKFVLDQATVQMNALAAKSKKMFAVQQGMKVAQALMNTYASATTNLAAYPAPLGPIMAAVSVAAGLAQVAQIKAQSFDGGGYTGNGSRTGGEDGKGGFMAMLHPKETVVDHSKGQTMQAPQQNIRIVNAFDSSVISDFIGSDDGERIIMNAVRRNQDTIRTLAA